MLITDIERLKAFLERNGVYEHHSATHGGYRRRKPKGDRHSKTTVNGHLKPYYGRFGWGFILEAPTVGDMRQNHKVMYFIRPDGEKGGYNG